MTLVGKNVYRCFKNCSFVPFFDTERLEQPKDRCICERFTMPPPPPPPAPSTASTSSSRRTSRGKSGGTKPKASRLPSIAGLLDIGFNEWTAEDLTKKHGGRTAAKPVSRRKSDRTAPNISECMSESGKNSNKESQPFKFYEDTSQYMTEYREKHVQKLVGFDGSSDPEDLTLGENLPDPYVFKTAPFRKAYEALQGMLIADKKQQTQSETNGPTWSPPGTYPSLTVTDRRWRPSEVKRLPGLTAQSMCTSNIDNVCESMRHVGQDVFRDPKMAKKRRSATTTSSSRLSLNSRQTRKDLDTASEKVELAMTQSRLAMRERLGVSDGNPATTNATTAATASTTTPSRESSSSSSRSQQAPPVKKTKPGTNWMAVSVDPEEATKTMLLFLQKARLDVDRARKKRARLYHAPHNKSQESDTEKKPFSAMLCRDCDSKPQGSSSETASKKEIKETAPSSDQRKDKRVKMKVFRASDVGEIKLEDALKAGRKHSTLCQGT
ncbi:uncharacterized protein [Diadema setosum]|uniref:uncharacterized protein n=1 Tax=Diadema setosum TaxID=31175 RepID=UPI003B3ABE13